MRLQRQSNREIITINPNAVVGYGGEARVYSLSQQHLVAKIYHQPTKAYAQKLLAMLANPPENPQVEPGHISIAWPVDVLRTIGNGEQIIGYLMPRVTGMSSIVEFYNPKTRREKCPFFNYLYLHRTARNLAAAVAALHARGYCIADVNESNILVSDTALVTLVDTDSFQVRDPNTSVIYRCPVGKSEFTPPELQGKSFAQVKRAPAHDLFGLGVLIFQLLMEGTHPFNGIYQGAGDPPSYATRISNGHFIYGTRRRVPYLPTPIAPPWEILHPELRELFRRCFEDGYKNPQARPNAQTWVEAINVAEAALVTCSQNQQHRYGNHLAKCPWCDRAQQLGGRDQFPSIQAVKSGQHLKPIQRRPTQLPPEPVLVPTSYIVPSRLPITPRQNSSNKVGALMLACGAGVLVFVEAMVIFHDIKITPQSTNVSATNQPLPSPTPAGSKVSLAYTDQGSMNYKLGNYKSAIENFNQALSLNPNDAVAYVNRGNARYQIAHNSSNPQDYYAAMDDFNQALRLDPQAADAYLSRGIVRYETAKYSKDALKEYLAAIADFNQAVTIDPKQAKAYVKRGIVRHQLAQSTQDLSQGYSAALDDFNQALRLNVHDAEAYIKRGLIRYEIAQNNGNAQAEYWAAIQDLQQGAKLFLEQGDLDRYQEAVGNMCTALGNNCQAFMQDPDKFMSWNLRSIQPQPTPRSQ